MRGYLERREDVPHSLKKHLWPPLLHLEKKRRLKREVWRIEENLPELLRAGSKWLVLRPGKESEDPIGAVVLRSGSGRWVDIIRMAHYEVKEFAEVPIRLLKKGEALPDLAHFAKIKRHCSEDTQAIQEKVGRCVWTDVGTEHGAKKLTWYWILGQRVPDTGEYERAGFVQLQDLRKSASIGRAYFYHRKKPWRALRKLKNDKRAEFALERCGAFKRLLQQKMSKKIKSKGPKPSDRWFWERELELKALAILGTFPAKFIAKNTKYKEVSSCLKVAKNLLQRAKLSLLPSWKERMERLYKDAQKAPSEWYTLFRHRCQEAPRAHRTLCNRNLLEITVRAAIKLQEDGEKLLATMLAEDACYTLRFRSWASPLWHKKEQALRKRLQRPYPKDRCFHGKKKRRLYKKGRVLVLSMALKGDLVSKPWAQLRGQLFSKKFASVLRSHWSDNGFGKRSSVVFVGDVLPVGLSKEGREQQARLLARRHHAELVVSGHLFWEKSKKKSEPTLKARMFFTLSERSRSLKGGGVYSSGLGLGWVVHAKPQQNDFAKLTPKANRLLRVLFGLLARNEDLKRSISLLRRAYKDYDARFEKESFEKGELRLMWVMSLLLRGDYKKANKILKESLDWYEKRKRSNQKDIRWKAIDYLMSHAHKSSWSLRYLGKSHAAEKFSRRFLKMARALKRFSGIAGSLHQLSLIALKRGNYPKAEKYSLQSLKMTRAIGNKDGIASSLHQLSSIAEKRGNYQKAEKYSLQSLKIKRAIGNKAGIASSLNQLGLISFRKKNYTQAVFYLDNAFGVIYKLQAWHNAGTVGGNLLVLRLQLKQWERAALLLPKVFSIWIRLKRSREATSTLSLFFRTCMEAKRWREAEKALRLLPGKTNSGLLFTRLHLLACLPKQATAALRLAMKLQLLAPKNENAIAGRYTLLWMQSPGLFQGSGGILVTRVFHGIAAKKRGISTNGWKAGLRRGDVLLSYNRHKLSGSRQLIRLVKTPGTKKRLVLVLRGRKHIRLKVPPGLLGIGIQEIQPYCPDKKPSIPTSRPTSQKAKNKKITNTTQPTKPHAR